MVWYKDGVYICAYCTCSTHILWIFLLYKAIFVCLNVPYSQRKAYIESLGTMEAMVL